MKDKFPKGYIKIMKKKKSKKIRNIPIDKNIPEKYFNDAKMVI